MRHDTYESFKKQMEEIGNGEVIIRLGSGPNHSYGVVLKMTGYEALKMVRDSPNRRRQFGFKDLPED